MPTRKSSIILILALFSILEVLRVPTGAPVYEVSRALTKISKSKTIHPTKNKSSDSAEVKNLVLSNLQERNWPSRVLWFNIEDSGHRSNKDDIWGLILRNRLNRVSWIKSYETVNSIASGSNTIEAELSYLCGNPKVNKEILKRCLPRILDKEGYQSRYYHANDLAFYRRHAIMHAAGFQYLYSGKDNERRSLFSSLYLCIQKKFCAPDDTVVYQKVISDAKRLKVDNRIFQFIMTLDTHGPHSGGRMKTGMGPHPLEYIRRLEKSAEDIVTLLSKYRDVLHPNESIFVIMTSDHPPRHTVDSSHILDAELTNLTIFRVGAGS